MVELSSLASFKARLAKHFWNQQIYTYFLMGLWNVFFMETLTTWKNHLSRWSQVMEEEEEEEPRAVEL